MLAPPDPSRLDPEALLAALVLDPATFSRNRFFELFLEPAVRRVRRRASIVRSVIALHAKHGPADGGTSSTELDELAGGVSLYRYEVPALGLRRTVRLDPLEAALVRYATARAHGAAPLERDKRRVEGALGRLLPVASGGASVE